MSAAYRKSLLREFWHRWRHHNVVRYTSDVTFCHTCCVGWEVKR